MAITNPNRYINSDLSVRLNEVNSQDTTVIVDKEAVMQSIYRLFKTEEGEIPFYRAYGLDLKQFLQKPLGESLAREINEYVSGKLEAFEQRAEVYKVNAVSNYTDNSVVLQYYVKIKSTGDIIGLEPLVVPIG
jgi:phage baseplate assembly protein W